MGMLCKKSLFSIDHLSLSVVSRINRVKILEHLLGVWAMDRKIDWSIWVVHSKMDVLSHYLRNGSNESSHHNITGKVAVRKANDEVFVLTWTNIQGEHFK